MRVQNATIVLATIALLLPMVILGRHVSMTRPDHRPRWIRGPGRHAEWGRRQAPGRAGEWGRRQGPADTVPVAGSRLPDCSHACGSCSPCRLVMVSFVCADLEEAETCPMAYRCMCNSKSYPVP
ncbi:uncharacterized protein [Typha angustifolia]|uniref:uncharacterized protein n=1 Tax=Typha angustifolia TaxID=59011 RepID=UPI003C2B2147